MSKSERDSYATRGKMQGAIIDALVTIEERISEMESNESSTRKRSQVLRALSTSSGITDVDQLKSIRKKYGAQSKEYKDALANL